MAYSKNIRQLATNLSEAGHSAEEISEILSGLLIKKDQVGFSSFYDMGKTFSIAFSEADRTELNKHVPEAKTIRKWISNVKGENSNSSLDKKIEHEAASVYPEKPQENDSVSVICQASPDNMDVIKLKN